MLSIRHGDLALIQINELPKGLIETKAKVIMTGSNNNDHTFENGKIYFKDKNIFIFGYLVAEKDCKLFHIDHGKKVKGKKLREIIVKKGIFELRKQCEDTHDKMKPIID